ncbi:hypothetical protein MMC25_007154 [Agyrium rufum]|nr:hypothetical protein [Agyrium rufum]
MSLPHHSSSIRNLKFPVALAPDSEFKCVAVTTSAAAGDHNLPQYISDEDGFHPEGIHLFMPPPILESVSDSDLVAATANIVACMVK